MQPTQKTARLISDVSQKEVSIMFNFLLGIIASIIAGLLIPGIRGQIIYYCQYLYQKFSGNIIDLTDTWEAAFSEVDEDGNALDSVERIKIIHKGKDVSGTGTIGDPHPRTFKYFGVLFQDLLYGGYEKEGTQKGSLEGRGVFLLQIDQTRKEMKGYCSYFDRDSNKIEASKYEWKRL